MDFFTKASNPRNGDGEKRGASSSHTQSRGAADTKPPRQTRRDQGRAIGRRRRSIREELQRTVRKILSQRSLLVLDTTTTVAEETEGKIPFFFRRPLSFFPAQRNRELLCALLTRDGSPCAAPPAAAAARRAKERGRHQHSRAVSFFGGDHFFSGSPTSFTRGRR